MSDIQLEFEEWASKHTWIEKNRDGHYVNTRCHFMWMAWQAAKGCEVSE